MPTYYFYYEFAPLGSIFCSRSNNLDFYYTAYTYNKKLTQHTMGLYITYYYLYYYTIVPPRLSAPSSVH